MAMKGRKGYDPKKRGSSNRKRKNIILLATEGKNKTETKYFRDYGKAKSKIIRFTPGDYTDPVNMISALIKQYNELELDPNCGDKAYCLIDADVNPDKTHQIAEADKLASKNGIKLILSAPCFEIWYLCHFGCNGVHYQNNREVIDRLCKVLPGYKKSEDGMYKVLCEKTKEAVQNAKALENSCMKAGYIPHTVHFSPSTEVYIIAEELGI